MKDAKNVTVNRESARWLIFLFEMQKSWNNLQYETNFYGA